MKNLCLTLFVLFTVHLSFSQIIKGTVAEYNIGVYDMTKVESWARINSQGGLLHNQQGFISFNTNYIGLQILDVEGNEYYEELKFQNDDFKQANLLNVTFDVIPTFWVKDENNNQITISYFSGSKFQEPGGIFVIQIKSLGKMYFLTCPKEEIDTVMDAY